MSTKILLKITAGFVTALILLLIAWFIYSDAERITLDDQVRAGLPGQFVELSNGVVHYQLAGPEDAPVVVLVHGFSVPAYVWDPTFEALAEAGFRVLRFDLYGRGYSDRPEVVYDQELFVKQLDELLSALKIDQPVSLVGLSFGGPVVTAFANQQPEQVRSLVLIDPQVAPVAPETIFPINLPILGEIIMNLYVAPVVLPTQTDFFNPDRFPDWEARYRDQMQYDGFRRAILSSTRNMVGVDTIAAYQTLGQGDMPVVLFWGREDQTVPAEDIALLRRIVPHIEFHPIDQAGHVPHYERPDVVNPLIIDFLGNGGN